jgi:iron complex transport system substrate-binding protein
MDAVKNGRIVVMDAHAMDATIRTISGIEVLADALKDSGLAK